MVINMSDKDALIIIDKIFKAVFLVNNTNTLEEILNKYAFDIKLPRKVYDYITNEETYTDFDNAKVFITKDNMEKLDSTKGFMLEKKDFKSLDEIIKTWENINSITTNRCYNSTYVSKSDTIYDSSYVYNSSNCSNSKNIVFCDGCTKSEYLLASQRSGSCTFSIRVDDSSNCSNSYSVICSNKISNSIFIQDCFNLDECIFCSHIANKKYCICNMQFEKDEYFTIKNIIIKWIINS